MQEVEFENISYQISFEAMPDTLKKSLKSDELRRYIQLLQDVQQKPKKAYPDVKNFAQTHAHIPEILNLLTFAHIQNFRISEAEELIEKTYGAYPDYFFARINYADQCIRKKKLDDIVKIFPTFNLQELYPGKTTYHTSEFRGFLIMASYYQLAKKNKAGALHYFKTAKEIEPHNPNVLYLEKKLFKKSLVQRLFRHK